MSSVESTITVRCFIPPESSIGYIPSTSCDRPTSVSRRSSSALTVENRTPLDSSSSSIIFPTLRVGVIALIAYWGTIEMLLNRYWFIALESSIGSSSPSSSTRPSMCCMRLSIRIRLFPSVDFPQPDSPARPMISPSSIPKVTPSTHWTSPRSER